MSAAARSLITLLEKKQVSLFERKTIRGEKKNPRRRRGDEPKALSFERRRRNKIITKRTTRWFLLTPLGQQNAPFRLYFRFRDFNQNSSTHRLDFRVFLRHFERLPGHRADGEEVSFRFR